MKTNRHGYSPFIIYHLSLITLFAGCTGATSAGSNPTAREEIVEDLFNHAIGLLNDSDRYNPSDVLPQITGRLNQWIALRKPLEGWRVDPLVERLPDDLRNFAPLKELARLHFEREDGLVLLEASWLRDVARTTVGRELDDLARANLLFDWTIRNIQLDAGSTPAGTAPRRPWEILLYGRGTAIERAWVFILLARQQGLDAVLLARVGDEATRGVLPDVWLPAVLIEKELYLYDPVYGLPIPGANGKGVATLGQVVAEPKIFGNWQLDAEHPYRYRPTDFEKVTAFVEGSILYLSERAKLMEFDLAGDNRLILSIEPSALVDRLRTCKHIVDVRLWALPIQRAKEKAEVSPAMRQALLRELAPFLATQPPLWRARVEHLMGKYTGDEGAIQDYQKCRPADADLDAARSAKKLSPGDEQVMLIAKRDASYWLGLVAFERGHYEIAIDYLLERTIKATPQGPWTEGARYNLGRAYEALGKFDDARAAYEQTSGEQRPGNLLRARSLEGEKPTP